MHGYTGMRIRIGGGVLQKQLLPRRQLPRSPFQYKHLPSRTGRCTLGSSTLRGRFPSQPLCPRPEFFPMMYGAALDGCWEIKRGRFPWRTGISTEEPRMSQNPQSSIKSIMSQRSAGHCDRRAGPGLRP